jgi:aquaporin Z
MRIRSFAYLHWHALKLASIAMKKFLMEFIGTFFLYFIIASMLLDPARAALAPLAVGIGLMALVYMGGHISRAHYNPAVTLAFYLRGQCEKKDIPGYIFAQLAGAILASWIVPLIQGGPEVTTWEVGGAPGLLAEFFGTYMLVLVILNVATVKGYEGNQYYGVAIGATVMAMAYAVGAYSGGSFNPAVTLGMILSGFLNYRRSLVPSARSVLSGHRGHLRLFCHDQGNPSSREGKTPQPQAPFPQSRQAKASPVSPSSLPLKSVRPYRQNVAVMTILSRCAAVLPTEPGGEILAGIKSDPKGNFGDGNFRGSSQQSGRMGQADSTELIGRGAIKELFAGRIQVGRPHPAGFSHGRQRPGFGSSFPACFQAFKEAPHGVIETMGVVRQPLLSRREEPGNRQKQLIDGDGNLGAFEGFLPI